MTTDQRKELKDLDEPNTPPPIRLPGIGPAYPVGVEFDGRRWVLLVEVRGGGYRFVPLALEGS